MKISSRSLTYLVLAGALLAFPSRAQAARDQMPQADDPSMSPPMVAVVPPGNGALCGKASFLESLNLTDAQLEKMAALKDDFETDTAGKKAELKVLFRKMHNLMTMPTIDRGQITAVHDRINALITDLSNARLNYMMDKADVLTPDQRKQIRHKILTWQAFGGLGRWHRRHMPHHG